MQGDIFHNSKKTKAKNRDREIEKIKTNHNDNIVKSANYYPIVVEDI